MTSQLLTEIQKYSHLVTGKVATMLYCTCGFIAIKYW